MKKKHCVLIIEDSPNVRLLLRRMFERDGYEVIEAPSAAAALERLAVIEPDVIMLDLGLPDRDGLEIIPILAGGTGAALIVLSARNSSEEKVCALDLGADDFVTKPFDVNEVLARVRTAIRHRIKARGAQWSVIAGDVEIDLINRRILKNGMEIHLTPKEYAVIAELAKYQGRVITHEQLLKSVWENDYEHHIEYLRVVIRSIRTKIEAGGKGASIILNERGVGYRLSSSGGDICCKDPMIDA
jgi:two-component system, OmpR family, KDP operon response regulator KdpE